MIYYVRYKFVPYNYVPQLEKLLKKYKGSTQHYYSFGLWTKGNMFASIVRESKGIN